MKKILSLLLVLLLITAPLCSVSASAQVSNEIMPLYNNVVSTRTSATISSSGALDVSVKYTGINGTTTRAIITTYIEKKTLGLFWTRVDIGTTNDEWVDTIYNYKYEGSHSHQLTKTGTYRVTVTYQIYGNGGAADEIVEEITKVY